MALWRHSKTLIFYIRSRFLRSFYVAPKRKTDVGISPPVWYYYINMLTKKEKKNIWNRKNEGSEGWITISIVVVVLTSGICTGVWGMRKRGCINNISLGARWRELACRMRLLSCVFSHEPFLTPKQFLVWTCIVRTWLIGLEYICYFYTV